MYLLQIYIESLTRLFNSCIVYQNVNPRSLIHTFRGQKFGLGEVLVTVGVVLGDLNQDLGKLYDEKHKLRIYQDYPFTFE
jgi:hypothetical protein